MLNNIIRYWKLKYIKKYNIGRTKAELPNLKYIIDSESKILNENSSNDSIYCHFKNNNIINQNRTSNTVYTLSKKFTEKIPPARPPPPTLTSASLNYKKITSNSNRSSIYFNFNNYEDEKKCLDSYLGTFNLLKYHEFILM